MRSSAACSVLRASGFNLRRCLMLLVGLSAALASNDDYYRQDDDYVNTAQQVKTCNNGVVQVSALELSCDSPYTFYYGNGANRNSAVCDYGDKATVTVYLDVSKDLYGSVDAIYATAAAYSGDGDQLFTMQPFNISENAGDDCRYAGSYSFTFKTQFAYLDGDDAAFVPVTQIAFGLGDEGDSSLGGVNIYCGNNGDDWTVTNQGWLPPDSFLGDYGILIVTVTAVSALGLALWRKGMQDMEDDHNPLLG